MNHLRGFLDSFLVTHTEPQAAHLDPMKTVHKHNMPQHQTALNLPKSWGVVYSGLPLQQQQLCPYASSSPSHSAVLLIFLCSKLLHASQILCCSTPKRSRPIARKQAGNDLCYIFCLCHCLCHASEVEAEPVFLMTQQPHLLLCCRLPMCS